MRADASGVPYLAVYPQGSELQSRADDRDDPQLVERLSMMSSDLIEFEELSK